MGYIFRSKILNNTLMGYSRKKSTHPQIIDGKILSPLAFYHISWTATEWRSLPGPRFLQSTFGSS